MKSRIFFELSDLHYGHRYFGTFFQAGDRLLKPGDLLVIQVITIPDQRYDEYRQEADWIQKDIFFGGLLPSVTVLCEAATKYFRCELVVSLLYPQYLSGVHFS